MRLKNWWYYHKWYVICGIIFLGIVLNVAGNALRLRVNAPDLQVAYIGTIPLPPETVSALEQAFSAVAEDFNNDGNIIVQINQYTDGLNASDAEAVSYEYASEISLIGDISECESYFFLLENPQLFQMEFQLLASPDGSCPDDMDYSIDNKVIAWSDCPALSQQDLGSYSTVILGEKVSGSNQDLLSSLFIGRRCFFTDKMTAHTDRCSQLWDLLSRSSNN